MLTRGAKRKAENLYDISSFPNQIIVIRQGESLKDKKGKDIPGLSPDGNKRAEYLKSFFTSPDNSFQIPNHIYTFNTADRRDPSRGELLMEPLAHELGIPINSQFRNTCDESDLVKDVFDNCKNQCVLICWEHNSIVSDIIPAIANTIGADFKAFKSWNWDPRDRRDNNPNLFSLIVVIDPMIQILTTANEDFQDFPLDHDVVSIKLP